MHGGMTSSMTWTATAWETWPGAAASFLAMWVVMTAAMMLPSMVPTFWRYRAALGGAGERRAGFLTALAGVAYLAVWAALGLIVFLLGVAIAAAQTWCPGLTRAAPIAAGVVVLIAGGIQLTRWKAHHLAHFREAVPLHRGQTDARRAWRYGLRQGRDCGLSCAGPMASLLVLGAMDLHVMVFATLAITAERLAPAGDRVARAIGVGGMAAGAVLIARGAGLG